MSWPRGRWASCSRSSPSSPTLADIHDAIRRFAAEKGIRAHDLLADFQRQPPPPQRYRLDVWHLSAAGHLVAAQALYAELFPPR